MSSLWTVRIRSAIVSSLGRAKPPVSSCISPHPGINARANQAEAIKQPGHFMASRYHGRVVLRVALLLGAAAAMATASNALRPRGLSWTKPLGPELRAQAVEAGLVPVDLDALRRLLKDKVHFLDSRPPDEFE